MKMESVLLVVHRHECAAINMFEGILIKYNFAFLGMF